MIEGCSKLLESMIDKWKSEYKSMMDTQDETGCGPMMRDVAELYWKGMDIVSCMQDELEHLRDGIVPATSRFSCVPAGHTGTHSDPTADLAFRIDILTKQIDETKKDVDCLARDISCGITYEITKAHDREIYRMRALQRMSYADIADRVGYSESYCRSAASRCGKLLTFLQ